MPVTEAVGAVVTGNKQQSSSNPAVSNVELIAELEKNELTRRSLAERISDAIVGFVGSLTFFVVHAVVVAVWVLGNLRLIPFLPVFDPYPFGLLTMIVSLESALLVIFVLISQNRMSRQSDKRDHLDLQVTMLVENEVTLALDMLRKLAEHQGIAIDTENTKVEELTKETDIGSVVKELEKQLPTLNE